MGPADGGTNGLDDDGVSHESTLFEITRPQHASAVKDTNYCDDILVDAIDDSVSAVKRVAIQCRDLIGFRDFFVAFRIPSQALG